MKRNRQKWSVCQNRAWRDGGLLCAVLGIWVSVSGLVVADAEEAKPVVLNAVKSAEIKQGTLAEVEPTTGPIVVLDGGGRIVARSVEMAAAGGKKHKKETTADRKLLIDSDLFGRIELPTDAVAGILFQPPPGIKARDAAIAKWFDDQPNKKRRADDRVTLVNGDQIEGPLLGIRNRRVTVDTAFGKTPIKVDQVVSIAFGSKGVNETAKEKATEKATPQKTPKYFTGWSDGSRFAAVDLVETGKKPLQVSPYLENQVAAPKPWTVASDRLRFVQRLGGETLVYLSDLTPSEYKHVPYLDRQLKLGIDRNVLGRPLRADKMLYVKGLGTPSRSAIAYTLAELFSRFEADLAIDDSTGGRGSVVFRVRLDGKTVYTSPTIRGGQPPVPISIDVSGAKLLELEVDYADRADQLDRADWLDARLKKE